MAQDIGVRIGVSGADQYKQSLKDITQETKAYAAELSTLGSRLDKNASSYEKNVAEAKALGNQIEAQQKKVAKIAEIQKDAASKYDESSYAVQRWNEQLTKATAELTELQKKADGINLNKMSLDLQDAGKKLQSIGGKMESVGKELTTKVTLPLVALGTACVKAASDFEENLNKINVAFGDSADIVKDWAETATDSFGLSKNAALEAAALFGDMGTSMGLTQEEAAEMATSLAGLAGDLASFKNISTDQAMNALKGVFTGETEALKSLGVVMNQTNLEAFAAKMGKSYEAADEAEKVMIRYQFVMEKTANAQGDYARSADGMANSLRTMQATLENLAVSFGQELLPAITPFIHAITEMLKAFNDLPKGVKGAITEVLAFAAVLGPVVGTIGKVVKGIGDLSTGIGTLMGGKAVAGGAAAAAGSGGGLAGLGTALSTAFATASTAIGHVVTVLAPFAPYIAAAAAAIAAIVIAFKNWDKITAAIGKAVEKAKEFATTLRDKLANSLPVQTLKAEVNKVVDAYKDAGGGIKGAMSAITTVVKDGWDAANKVSGGRLNEVVNTAKDKFNSISGVIGSAMKTASATMSKTLGSLQSTFGQITSQLSAKAKDLGSTIASGIKNGLSGIVSAVVSIFESIGNKVMTIARSAMNWGKELAQNLAKGMNSGNDNVRNASNSTANIINAHFHFSEPDVGPLSNFHTWMPDMMHLMAQGIRDNMGLVKSAVDEVANVMYLPAHLDNSAVVDGLDRLNTTTAERGNMAVNVTLQGDASKFFRAMVDQNHTRTLATGYNIMAARG